MLDWERIDQVLLDMDGTLLDLHFDSFFWLEHLPRRYAEALGIPLDESKRRVMARSQALGGTLDWYCLDHWTETLGLDIALLKREVEHLIAVHPHVLEFLEALKVAGKRRVLVTNAHQKSLALKLEKTRLGGHLEQVVCAHDLGLPKEDRGFWARLQAVAPFDPQRSLFVDDNPEVLASARDYGIRHLLAVRCPDNQAPAREFAGFEAICRFSEVLPGLAPASAPGDRAETRVRLRSNGGNNGS